MGELVDACLSQHISDGSYARVAPSDGYLRALFVGVGNHGSEFYYLKGLAVKPDALLKKKNGALGAHRNGNGGNKENR